MHLFCPWSSLNVAKYICCISMFQSTYLVFVSSAFSRLEFLLDQNMQNSECTISGTANVMYSPLKAVNKYFITKICVVL